MNQNYYSLGLMSGTSMDGVDASIIKSDGELSLKIIDEMYFEYEDKLKLELKEIVKQATSKKMIRKFKSRIKDLEENITKFHAHISNFIIKKNKGIKIDIVGFHGQTILHKPKEGYSIQIGNPRLLSKLIKKKVVFNFREKDIINGGQGAPLSPLYHRLLIHKIKLNYPSAIINIGGISNITYFNDIDDLCSFDLGPGNCLIDQWIYKHTEKNFDKNGLIAKQGNIDEKILKKLLKNIYYKKNIPKSLDLKNFNLIPFKKLSVKDGAATISMYTVNSICNSIKKFGIYPKNILMSGGGRKNKFIMEKIKSNLKCKIFKIDKFGFDGDFIESQAFAYLAIRSYLKKIITLPVTTGVKIPSSGGKIYQEF